MHRWHTDSASVTAATAVTAAAEMSSKMVWKPSQPSSECMHMHLWIAGIPTRERGRNDDDKKTPTRIFRFWYESRKECVNSLLRDWRWEGSKRSNTKDTYWYFIARHFPCAHDNTYELNHQQDKLEILCSDWTGMNTSVCVCVCEWARGRDRERSEREERESEWTITRTFRLWSKCNIFIRIRLYVCSFHIYIFYLFCVSITLFLKISRYI